jgi:Glycosyltransferase family 87
VGRPLSSLGSFGRWLGRGRSTAAVVVAGYIGLLEALGGYWQWGRLGVPPLATPPYEPFADMRMITSGWECTRRGLAVLPINPCDPWGRPANFPRIWMFPSFLGLGQSSTAALAYILAAVFLVAAIAVVPRDAPRWSGAVFAAALCSPAVMLGVERGNVDIGLFGLLVVAVRIFRRHRFGIVAGSALVLLMSILKLFPILAVGFFFRRIERRALLAAAIVLAAFGAYLLGTWHYTVRVLRAVLQYDRWSFGVRRVTEWLVAGVNGVSPHTAASVNVRAVDAGVVVVVVALAVLGRHWLRRHLPEGTSSSSERNLDLFWAGACTYVGAYAVFRSWDYRLAFVLLAVPQLAEWARMRRGIGIVTLVALFAAAWLEPAWTGVPFIGHALSLWNRATSVAPFREPLTAAVTGQFVLFGGLVCGLVATLPCIPARIGGVSSMSGAGAGAGPAGA